MKARKHSTGALFAAIGMLVLILDGKTALEGAANGIDICLRTVIPSLFPFFVLSILLTDSLQNVSFRTLTPLGQFCGMREGTEPLLLTGLLGGYPVGAQAVMQAYKRGSITQQEANRLLGFCNNAGPAFIFGIAGSLFSSRSTVWILWGIHVLSALIVGACLPGRLRGKTNVTDLPSMTLPAAVAKALRITGTVCGWIILFRVLISFLNRWILWLLPQWVQLMLIGMLELANGCHSLFQAESESIRFIIGAAILSFGGICVGMQTISITGDFGTGMYFPGKLMQSLCSVMLSAVLAPFLFTEVKPKYGLVVVGVSLIVFCFIRILLSTDKKRVAFWPNDVYNG